ncbi:hypothetical protein FPJ27_08230 [Burkholderia sp. MS455]|uniref:hypothetical protein n=1 Tax=Burkholderia sp. MS455 TaxID=2811788 RepID=UPI0019583D94|nr:hypothetical protein [Burkholderia sp. MS455]QRR06417.1 hypothetical protein FPJ27_08230 [Burkholderia sp. MS455]
MRGIDQVLAALFLVAAISAAGAGLYAKHEHARAGELQDKVQKVERERDGYIRALDAQKVAEKKAQERHTAASDRLAAAIKGNPAAADTAVPDAIWDAIYGDSNEGN